VIALLPPLPSPGSEAMTKDEAARTAALPLMGTARYTLAAADAVRSQRDTVNDFQCAFGIGITPERTRGLYELLSRLRLDVRAASYPAKSHFKRRRPFDLHNSQTCYRDDEAMARDDWSYPSARGAVGWTYALVLAELRPDRAKEILQRGRDFGESRIICDQEWRSDIEAGKVVATATLKRIQRTDRFKADIAAAQKEVALEVTAGANRRRTALRSLQL